MCLPEPDEDHKVARELSNSTQKGQLSGKKKEKKKKKKKRETKKRSRLCVRVNSEMWRQTAYMGLLSHPGTGYSSRSVGEYQTGMNTKSSSV